MIGYKIGVECARQVVGIMGKKKVSDRRDKLGSQHTNDVYLVLLSGCPPMTITAAKSQGADRYSLSNGNH